jgi:hypothetical protein
MEKAEVMMTKMQGNIKARSIFQMLEDYPPREYPEPELLPAKKGARGAPPPKAPPPKKKGKKTPPFPTPDWALQLDAVVETVKNMETLVVDKANLELS